MRKLERLLLKMKDTTELMIDLAYSALLYDNKAIAKEVHRLEDLIDRLNMQIQQEAVERTAKEHPEAALFILRLSNSLEIIGDAALQIADITLRGMRPHPIFQESVKAADVSIARIYIPPRSPIVNKTLGELRLASETGMWIIAIRRKKRWIFGPDEFTTIKGGDILIGRGPEEGVAALRNAVLRGIG
jgi:uncharacterized protein with PhoU and TrkA domain